MKARNKFVRKGRTLSGVGGLSKTPLSHEHYRQTFIGLKILIDTDIFS